MPKISTYNTVTPTVNDKLIGTDTDNNNVTKNFTIADIIALVPGGSASVQTLIPEFITATPGGSTVITTTKNIIDLTWSGGSGIFDLILPSAADIPYRFLRIVNDSTVIASDKVHVVAPGTETIDGDAFYVINKAYNGCAVWSDGSEWIVIQAKL